MVGEYRQLTFFDRRKIEEGLGSGLSYRKIADALKRSPATIAHEVETNRTPRAAKVRKEKCRERNWCKRISLCETCARTGAYCSGCDLHDCRDLCRFYHDQTECDVLAHAPWVCNACRKNRYGCNRANRWVYRACEADSYSRERRSISRRGMNRTPEEMSMTMPIIRNAVKRGLSPYEVSVLYAEQCRVSPSTIYRWVEAGYADLCNLDLERKVGFRKRAVKTPATSTAHSKRRSYGEFEKLEPDMQDSATEMDCVEGFRTNEKALLTLYHRPTHLQLAILLAKVKDPACVHDALRELAEVCDPSLFSLLFSLVLTDNGMEFSDEGALASIFKEEAGQTQLFYCDPRHAEQKGRCEKNHSELRQILPKGRIDIDALDKRDIAIAMSHANSNPRASLCRLSPIDAFGNMFGEAGRDLLTAFGVEKVEADELMLKPTILDIERGKRGEQLLNI